MLSQSEHANGTQQLGPSERAPGHSQFSGLERGGAPSLPSSLHDRGKERDGPWVVVLRDKARKANHREAAVVEFL